MLWALAGLALTILMWELVKWLGGIVALPFKTSDSAMPHVWTMWAGALQPEVRGSETTVLQAVVSASLYSLLIAMGGFVIGVSIGLLLAVIMQRFAFMERGLLPVRHRVADRAAHRAGAPHHGHRQPDQHRADPVEHDLLRHVHRVVPRVLPHERRRPARPAGADGHALELMRSYAATPRATLFKLRFPASLPYLVPAMKVSAAAAVVGTVVAEISTGVRGGIGRLIVEYAREATAQPAKVYVAVFGAITLGPDGRGTRHRHGRLPDPQPAQGEPIMSTPTTTETAVRATGIWKVFNEGLPNEVTALQDIDLTVGQGEFISLIGPSGCGKSTLLRVIADLTDATRGEMEVAGMPAAKAREEQRYGIAFQQAALFDWRTVRRNVELPARAPGLGQGQAARPRDGAARDGAARRLRRPPAVGALRRHAAARRDRPLPRRRPAAPAHGRALRRPRRDDPRAHAERAAPHPRWRPASRSSS